MGDGFGIVDALARKLKSNGMNAPSKVAVILINRNGFKLTEACVKSLLESRYPNLLIVITDNGSNPDDLDQLAGLARSEKSVVIHPLGYNAGFTKANNAGIHVALGFKSDEIERLLSIAPG